MTAMWIVGLSLVVFSWVGFVIASFPMDNWLDGHRIFFVLIFSLLVICFTTGTFLIVWGATHGG